MRVPHTTMLVRKPVTILQHPLYSPDLSPTDYFAFLKLKLDLTGRRFEDIESDQQNVTAGLKAIPHADLEWAMRCFTAGAQRYIDVRGSVF